MVLSLFRAIVQTVDFAVKAMKHYATTPEGQAELTDIIQALEGDTDPESDNPAEGEVGQ